MLVTHRPMFWQAVGQYDRRVMSVLEEGKQLAPSLTTSRTSSLRFLRERIIGARRFRSHFSQENTPIDLPYPQGVIRWSSLCVAMPLS